MSNMCLHIVFLHAEVEAARTAGILDRILNEVPLCNIAIHAAETLRNVANDRLARLTPPPDIFIHFKI